MGWAMMGTGAISALLMTAGVAATTPQNPPPPPPAGQAEVSVSPGNVAPGSKIRITVHCPNARNAPQGHVDSPAFTTLALAEEAAPNGGLFAEPTVRVDVSPGPYEVVVTCPDQNTKLRGTLTIYGVPSSGPPTGGGYLAKDHTSLLASGAVLLAVGGGLAAYAFRRREQ